MDNKTALFLAIVIVGVFLADHFYFHWELAIFIYHQLTRFTDWMAFWRDF